MSERDLVSEFKTLSDLLVGLQRVDDNGPILTIEEVLVVSESSEVIEGRIVFADHRTPGRSTRTSDFDYDGNLAVGGPEDAADLLLVNLEEEVLAAD